MDTLLQAIARREGFFVPGSRPARNLNPGDLEYNAETIHFGATHGDPRFAVFADLEPGWDALRRWLSIPAKFAVTDADPHYLAAGYLGATLEQVIYRFAPPSENDSAKYLDDICEMTGLTPETVLTAELLA